MITRKRLRGACALAGALLPPHNPVASGSAQRARHRGEENWGEAAMEVMSFRRGYVLIWKYIR
jgi:hypothetical protein